MGKITTLMLQKIAFYVYGGKEVKMFKKIHWKTIQIGTITEGGICCLKGELKYWEKDLHIHLTEPIRSTVYSGHLAYTIPSTFFYDGESDEVDTRDDRGWIRVNLFPVE